MSDADNDSWAPWPREYISSPRAATSSMSSQRSVPYIMPPASRHPQLLPPSDTSPSRNYVTAPSGSMSRQPSSHTTPSSRSYGVAPSASASRQSSSHTTSPSRNVSQILDRLYISDLSFAENPVLLSSYQITHILSTLPDAIIRPPPSLLPHQPVRMQIELDDFPFAELAAYLPRTTSFIQDALSNPEARVLVHCVEGISRSVSVVAAYLVAEHGWSPKDAVEYIKTRRPVANPNFGFVQQLSEYSMSLSNPIHSSEHPHPLPPFSAPHGQSLMHCYLPTFLTSAFQQSPVTPTTFL